MPIFEYYCEGCSLKFEMIFQASSSSPRAECCLCPKCSEPSLRIMSEFNIGGGPLSGVDDTDELTLGKIVANKGIPAEFKPTIKELQERKCRIERDKAYAERVKKYDLDKPTKAEVQEAESKKIKIVSK